MVREVVVVVSEIMVISEKTVVSKAVAVMVARLVETVVGGCHLVSFLFKSVAANTYFKQVKYIYFSFIPLDDSSVYGLNLDLNGISCILAHLKMFFS